MKCREDLADGERKIESFLSSLAAEGKVSASTQNQAFKEGLRVEGAQGTSSDFLSPVSMRLCFSAAA
jgi:hypothetical protein